MAQGDKTNFFRDYQYLKLLLQLHRLTATVEGSIPAPGHNKLCATFLTNISLPNLIRHLMYLLTNLNPKHEIRNSKQFQITKY